MLIHQEKIAINSAPIKPIILITAGNDGCVKKHNIDVVSA